MVPVALRFVLHQALGRASMTRKRSKPRGRKRSKKRRDSAPQRISQPSRNSTDEPRLRVVSDSGKQKRKPPVRKGRRSLLEKDDAIGGQRLRSQLLAVIRVGAGKAAACRTVGIGQSTLERWLMIGRRELMAILEAREDFAEVDAESLPLYARFAWDFDKAEGADKVVYLSAINKAAREGDWRAAAWGLERRWPKEFGPKGEHHHVVSKGPDLSKLSDEELERWRELEAKAGE